MKPVEAKNIYFTKVATLRPTLEKIERQSQILKNELKELDKHIFTVRKNANDSLYQATELTQLMQKCVDQYQELTKCKHGTNAFAAWSMLRGENKQTMERLRCCEETINSQQKLITLLRARIKRMYNRYVTEQWNELDYQTYIGSEGDVCFIVTVDICFIYLKTMKDLYCS